MAKKRHRAPRIKKATDAQAPGAEDALVVDDYIERRHARALQAGGDSDDERHSDEGIPVMQLQNHTDEEVSQADGDELDDSDLEIRRLQAELAKHKAKARPNVRLQSSSGSDAESEGDEQALTTRAWGRNAFHDADESSCDDDEDGHLTTSKAEEKAALAAQRRQASALRPDDFAPLIDDDSFGSRVRQQGGGSKKTTTTTTTTASAAAVAKKSKTKLHEPQHAPPLDEPARVALQADASSLSREEKLALLEAEAPELLQLLADLQAKVAIVRTQLTPLLDRVRAGELPTSDGLSFLEMKYHLLLAYCTDILFFMLLKVDGQSVRDHPIIEELVTLRTILEKIAPLESKLQYQIGKLLRVAAGGGAGVAEDDATAYRPNPRAMLLQAPDDDVDDERKGFARDDDDDDDENDDDAGGGHGGGRRKKIDVTRQDHDGVRIGSTSRTKSSAGRHAKAHAQSDDERDSGEGAVYVPPRLGAVLMPGDEASGRNDRDAKQLRARLRKSELLRELRQEFSEAPVESVNAGAFDEADEDPRLAAKRKFEEDHMVRLNETRADRKALAAQQRRALATGVDIVSEFVDLQALDRLRKREADAEAAEITKQRSLEEYLRGVSGRPARKAVSADEDVRKGKSLHERQAEREMREVKAAAKRARDAQDASGDDARGDDGAGDGTGDSRKLQRTAGASDTGQAARRAAPAAEEDELYLAAKAKREAKQRLKDRYVPERAFDEADDGEASDEAGDGKRAAGRAIMSNRGLTPYRKKEGRNPRVKGRRKYESALKRRVGAVPNMREREEGYGGETRTIRTGLAKSVRLS